MGRTLRLDVLGPFRAEWSDGTPLEVTGKKIQGLLGYLAVESARPHSREQVAALLWSDTGDERARHNLRQALSKIRRAYGPLIESVGESLTLDPALCTVGAQHRLRRTACDVIERLAAALADAERADEAVAVLDRRIAMDPACEPAHRHLMELYERLGRRSDALRAERA